jgi:hypothetical protein
MMAKLAGTHLLLPLPPLFGLNWPVGALQDML